MNIAIYVVTTLLLFGIALTMVLDLAKNIRPPPSSTTTVNTSSSQVITPIPPSPRPTIPSDWTQYTNDILHISFAIPKNFTIESHGDFSVMAKPEVTEPTNRDIEFFYVSIVPKDKRASNNGEIYNYGQTFQQKLLSLNIGETKNLSDIEGQQDWYMYERQADVTIHGRTAKVFINQRPWEFPAGTWEYRYIFELPEKSVIAGGYIVGGPSDTPLSLPTFDKIISSLQIGS